MTSRIELLEKLRRKRLEQLTRDRESLRGEKGETGRDGLPGRNGIDGRDGRDGVPGQRGFKGEKGDLGATGLVWRGQWIDNTEYRVNDAVFDLGSAFICIQQHKSDVQNRPPIGSKYQQFWAILAEKGDAGAAGAAGAPGANGSGGDPDAMHLSGDEIVTGNKTFQNLVGLGFADDETVLMADLDGAGGQGWIVFSGTTVGIVRHFVATGALQIGANFSSNKAGILNIGSDGTMQFNTDDTGATFTVHSSTSSEGLIELSGVANVKLDDASGAEIETGGAGGIQLNSPHGVFIGADGGLANLPQYATADAPSYVEGGMYYDLTLHKLRIGGVSDWETVVSA